MRMRHLVAALMVFGSPALATAETADGYWLTENGKAIVRFDPCGEKVCGTMVWVANPTDQSGAPKLDTNNTDANQRARPICGLPLLGDLDLAKAGRWEDGWIYNPRDGETYSAEVELVSQSQLKVRGFLGISLFGSSQVWTRVSDDRGGCP